MNDLQGGDVLFGRRAIDSQFLRCGISRADGVAYGAYRTHPAILKARGMG